MTSMNEIQQKDHSATTLPLMLMAANVPGMTRSTAAESKTPTLPPEERGIQRIVRNFTPS